MYLELGESFYQYVEGGMRGHFSSHIFYILLIERKY